MDASEAYYPPPAEWHFASPTVLSEWDARSEAAGSPLGEANFLRSAEWSPDGTAILTTAEDRTIRIFDLPWETLAPLLTPSYEARLQAPLYSALWHPYAHRADPATWCFLQACDSMPVKLLNAATGELQGSYAIIDHQERFVAPHALAFTPSLAHLYCGFLEAIEIFTLAVPGAQGERIKTTSSKASKSGQKGPIAALAICPDGSGTYVAGSYAGSAVIYDKAHKRICALKGIEGRGVTQIEFHPLFPHIVYLSSRRSPYLVQAFSLLAPRRPFANFPRSPTSSSAGSNGSRHPSPRGSNQRGRFSLDRWGRYLVVGDEAGRVGFYDISADGEAESAGPKSEPISERWPGYVLQAGKDAISTAVVHPFLPILATVSGSRHELPLSSSSSSSSESESESENEGDGDRGEPASSPTAAAAAQHSKTTTTTTAEAAGQAWILRPRRMPRPTEAKLRIWSFAAPAAAAAATAPSPPPPLVSSLSSAAAAAEAGAQLPTVVVVVDPSPPSPVPAQEVAWSGRPTAGVTDPNDDEEEAAWNDAVDEAMTRAKRPRQDPCHH